MKIKTSFPGGVAVDTVVGDHVVRTDQPEKYGGGGSAPPPFDLFLASIATCAGFYALRFCQRRDIDTSELGVTLETVHDETTKRITDIGIRVELPPDFPDKYRSAIVRAIDQCAVKQHILDPPRFAVETAELAPTC